MAETSTAMTAHAAFRFYAALNAFLTLKRRGRCAARRPGLTARCSARNLRQLPIAADSLERAP
jgi:hypothetical protein